MKQKKTYTHKKRIKRLEVIVVNAEESTQITKGDVINSITMTTNASSKYLVQLIILRAASKQLKNAKNVLSRLICEKTVVPINCLLFM